MSQMIVPDPIDEIEIDKIVNKSFQELILIAEENYKLSYANWEPENQPEFFTSPIKYVGTRAEIEYSTDSVPFVWVDDGTKAHDEKAKNEPFMKFPDRNIPKTRPGQLASFSSFQSKTFVTAKKVRNPGIKKRGFTEIVQKILDDNIEQVVDKYHREARTL